MSFPNTMKYRIVIYWSPPDGAYVAEAPELPGCKADGRTYEEALANMKTAVRSWIAAARSLRRRIPRPKL